MTQLDGPQGGNRLVFLEFLMRTVLNAAQALGHSTDHGARSSSKK